MIPFRKQRRRCLWPEKERRKEECKICVLLLIVSSLRRRNQLRNKKAVLALQFINRFNIFVLSVSVCVCVVPRSFFVRYFRRQHNYGTYSRHFTFFSPFIHYRIIDGCVFTLACFYFHRRQFSNVQKSNDKYISNNNYLQLCCWLAAAPLIYSSLSLNGERGGARKRGRDGRQSQ